MLLPSDVARLVLGYLQQEGLSTTSRAFILESPNLREYAEHSSEDGVIPACVFSLFGKNLTTILNEYVAVKAKETCHENQLPVVMTSLWKKLDFTLNQIKSMQNSPSVQHNQRLRTQNSILNMQRQRALSSHQTSATVCLSVSTPGNCVARPVQAPQGILGHSTPVCYTSQQIRPSTISLSQSEDSPLQIMVPDHRFTPGPLSPARRKCDSPRRRGGQPGISRGVTATSMLTVESQSQETVAENLSQMVIENAREKILSDPSLQEKLAENINKILASDNSPQTLKAACSAVEQEQSIDEILGLQGEIHMTDDAIQDILEQTESDPAFQALFDLFDYGKNKMSEGSENAERSNTTQDSDETGHVDSATDTGTGQEDSTSGVEATTRILRSRSVKQTKNNWKKSLTVTGGRSDPVHSQPCAGNKPTTAATGAAQNKKCSSKSRVPVSKKQARGTNSGVKGQRNSQSKPKSSPSSDPNASSASLSEEGAGMEVDYPVSEVALDCNTDGTPQQVLQKASASSNNAPVSSKQVETIPEVGADLSGDTTGTEMVENMQIVPRSPEAPGKSELLLCTANDTSMSTQASSQQLATSNVSLLNTVIQQESSSKTTSMQGPIGPFEPLSSVVPVSTATNISSSSPPSSSSSTVISSSQSPAFVSDPNKVVALKIIISDEQARQGSDSTLNQAVSSITSDPIPTIFLSSPVKSQTKVLPSSSPFSITQEETAQAVNNLQGTESAGDSDITTTQNNFQLAQERAMAPETGFIQMLPANPTFGGGSSYFVVTDANSGVDQHSSVMLLPGGAGVRAACSTPHTVGTPPRPRAVVTIAPNVVQPFSPASAIIISSPVQPMIQNMAVPVSVLGQNSTAKLTVVPSQMLGLPSPKLVTQPAKFMAKNPKLAPKDDVDLGKTATCVNGSNQVSNSPQSSEQIISTSGANPGHRRILCFEENTSQMSTSPSTTSAGIKDSTRTERALLSNTSTKRRIETIRLSEPSQNARAKESGKAFMTRQEQEVTQSDRTETGTDISSTSVINVQQNPSVRLESKKKIPPTSKMEGDSTTLSKSEHSVKTSSQSLKPKSAGIGKDPSQEEKHEQRPANPPEEPSESNATKHSPRVTANKENELQGGRQELRQVPAPVLSTLKSTVPVSQVNFGKPTCKTSPLTKQAVEMLQGIQSQSPISTPSKLRDTSDLPIPKTPVPGRLQEDLLDGLKTPSRQRHGHGRESEGTPKLLAPPTTPDLPSCSPASEAGSENSINMAAHTLMILSRAARTGGPLKDSLRQEETGVTKSSASKGKKRKQTESSPSAKKELQLTSLSGSKKKAKRQKKLLDSFPHDLDVDKFLSSLHYDE